mgnify:CR=1 FL=1
MTVEVRRISLLLLVAIVAWGVAYAAVIASMVDVWYASETYKHCFFILPIVIYLIYERRAELSYVVYKPGYWALALLALAQVLWLSAELLGINLFAHTSAYLSLVALLCLILGSDFAHRFWFPLLFLGFSVPFGEELVPLLQDLTAYITVELLQAVGIPIYREGLYLYVPNGTFLVAEACAGIRFLIASFALGTLFAYLNYRTAWKFYGFILASLIVPIIANGLRAFGIVVIGYLSDMEHATGADHLVYGWFFFAFVLLLLFFIGQLGQEDTRPSKVISSQALNIRLMLPALFIGILALSSIVPSYIHFVLQQTPNIDATLQRNNLLAQLQNFKQIQVDWQPQLQGPDAEWAGTVKGKAVYIGSYFYDREAHELVSGQHRYYNIDAYTRKSFERVSISRGRANRIDLVDVSGNQVRLFYWFEVDGQATASSLATKLNQAISKLSGRYGSGRLLAVQAQNIEQLEAIIEVLP